MQWFVIDVSRLEANISFSNALMVTISASPTPWARVRVVIGVHSYLHVGARPHLLISLP